eukprot:335118-Rhodomonas_salina.1
MAVRVLRRIKASIYKDKELDDCIEAAQKLAATVPSWTSSGLTQWITDLDTAHLDIRNCGASSQTADACMIKLAIKAIGNAPDAVQKKPVDWHFKSSKWLDTVEESAASFPFHVFQNHMETQIKSMTPDHTKTTTPPGMALSAITEAASKLADAANSFSSNAPPTRTFQSRGVRGRGAGPRGNPRMNRGGAVGRGAGGRTDGDDDRVTESEDGVTCDICGGDHHMSKHKGLRKVFLDKDEKIKQLQAELNKSKAGSGMASSAQASEQNAKSKAFAKQIGFDNGVSFITETNTAPRFRNKAIIDDDDPVMEHEQGFHIEKSPPGTPSVSWWRRTWRRIRPANLQPTVFLFMFILITICGRTLATHTAPTHHPAVNHTVWAQGMLTTFLSLPLFKALESDDVVPINARMANYSYALRAFEHDNAITANNHIYFMDSCCSYTIVNTTTGLSDIYDIPGVQIDGYAGGRIITKAATLTLTVPDFAGNPYTITVHNVLYDPQATVNLISAKQLTGEGFGVFMLPHDGAKALTVPNDPLNYTHGLPMVERNNVFFLQTFDAETPAPSVAYKSFYNMTFEELMHLRFNHVPVERLAHMNDKVRGLARRIRVNKRTQTPCPSHTCTAANAKHNPFPDPSPHLDHPNKCVWHMDLFDMGDNFRTLGGNRYATFFVVRGTRYVMLFLHKTKDFATTRDILNKARAKCGYWCDVLISDGDPVYTSQDFDTFCSERHIDHHVTPADEQFFNGLAETFVNTVGRGIRSLLDQSGLGPEFWGLAALHVVQVYNVLPHSALDMQIPYTLQHKREPDISWFRPFGCSATTYRGQDVLEHHKIAPRGEKCVYVGVGLHQGRKATLTFSPRLNRVYATTQVTFDETLFPARAHDQRIYGFYDDELVKEMRADLVSHQFNTTSQWTTSSIPDPVWTPADITPNPDATVPPTTTLEQPDNDDDLLRAELADLTAGMGLAGAQGLAGVPTVAGDTDTANSNAPADPVIADDASAGDAVRDDHFPNVRYNERRQRMHLKDATSAYGTEQTHWKDCQNQTIDSTTDEALAEYLVGYNLDLRLDQDYWPDDGGAYTISCADAVKATAKHRLHKKGVQLIEATIIAGPKASDIGTPIHIAVSGRYSIRRVLTENHPQAVTCKDLLRPLRPATRSRASGVMAMMGTMWSNVTKRIKGRIQIDTSQQHKHSFVAYTAITQVIAASALNGSEPAFLSPEPKNSRDARKRPDADDWIQSELKENKKVLGMGTFIFVPNHKIPEGTTLIPTKYSYKCKYDKWGNVIKKNARLCVRGDMQGEDEYTETFAPTSRFNALRCVFATAAQQGHKLYQFDVKGAFMVSDISDKDIYVELPSTFDVPPGHTAMLAKSLYGLKDAAFRYHCTFTEWLIEYGCEPLDSDRTMFKYVGDHGSLIISIYVDDGLVSTDSDEEYKIFINALQDRFELSADDSEVTWYLGVSVHSDRQKGYVHLNQEKYINDMLARFKMSDVKPALTPMEVGVRLTSDDQPNPKDADKDTVRHYQQLVGSLMYTLTWCHPEIGFAVQQCAKYMANPGPSHVKAAKRVLAYLQGAKKRGLTYRCNDDVGAVVNQLYVFADADHAGDPEGRRSVTGYVVMLNGAAISWQSVRQTVTALSSAEAEYYAASAAGCDVVAMRRILEEMGHEQVGPTPLAEDNIACIYMSKSSAMYHKSKHIDVRVYKLREFVRDGVMTLHHVPTNEQVADVLTKSLPSPAFVKHRDKMCGYPPDLDTHERG